jgi:hypothetical protein
VRQGVAALPHSLTNGNNWLRGTPRKHNASTSACTVAVVADDTPNELVSSEVGKPDNLTPVGSMSE